ncbi:MAG: RagB/SusD family nutrient uptake outer membrane protein [Syntrophomonadaceae bacterium]|nr:RagB/SusD family nutrient uptake outer membrane protein [Syntrophomonadaceae bacterium]
MDHLTVAQYYKTDADLKGATAPLYGLVWYDYTDKFSYEYGEGMAGNLQGSTAFAYFNTNGANSILSFGWNAMYNIIVHACFIINDVTNNSGSDVTETAKKKAIGEACLFRAMAYSNLIHIWGEGVPIIDDPMALLTNPNRKRVVPEDVYAYIFNDLYTAKNNLPESWPGSDLGRLTKWSAEAFLAKMYLHHAGLGKSIGSRLTAGLGLDSAKFYARDVILNSGASLMPNYADIFTSANNNNSESLIALQYNSNQGNSWGAQNGRQAYLAGEGKITGAGDGWGRNWGASEFLLKLFRKDPLDLRRKAVFMMDGDTFPEILKAQGGYIYTFTDICNVKKYIIGTAADNDGHVGFMSTDICYYIMRLPEVYLIYAEAILGNNSSTSDAEALEYYNLVRRRAGLPDKSSLTFKDIFDEKLKEFAFEDQAMFEYIRWFYFDPNAAMAALQNQHRPVGELKGYSVTRTGPNQYDFQYFREVDQVYKVEAANMYLPYPETELIEDPDLAADPVHFPYN